ncbi:MAG: 50S ribosomal protein L29 [Proteobacteria bacterium]|nr:50S ribosomal protein L29 [Pseudomonadota bacterium]
MEYLKITAEELRPKDKAELQLAAGEVRKKLAELRMDIYTAAAVKVSKAKKLRRGLARILTVENEKARVKA